MCDGSTGVGVVSRRQEAIKQGATGLPASDCRSITSCACRKRASLSIDNVYYTSQVLDPQFDSHSFAPHVSELFLGTHSGGGGFQGCVGTYRWSNQNLPLLRASNQAIDPGNESIVSITKSEGVFDGCSLLITCAQLPIDYCSGTMVCMDFWKGAFCTCPEGAKAMLGDDGQLVGCGEILTVTKLGISNSAITLVLVSLLLFIKLVMLMVMCARQKTTPFETVRLEDFSRDNLRLYSIEGGGETDNDQHSTANLQKLVIDGNDDRLQSHLHDLELDQNAAPFDEVKIYGDEIDTVSVVTLGSLGSLLDTEWQQKFNWEAPFNLYFIPPYDM
ncbi:hypothetical protein RB195_008081 [Necator americanus]|uniref:Uncharacterized protein n=1 Tax=Necator americanus TaxID=51031 RepID=A0ABR1CMY0_NECAM